MGQREEIERLVGEAYADLRLQKWGEFERKVSELSLYPKGLVEDVIREKMGKVQPPRAMHLASIHEAVEAFPEGVESSSPQKGGSLTEEIGQVEYPLPTLPVELLPEPLRTAEIGWLAGMIDAESTVGETRWGKDQIGRIDRKLWRLYYSRPRVRFYNTTYELVTRFAELTGVKPPPREKPLRMVGRTVIIKGKPYRTRKPYYAVDVPTSRAIKLLILTEPHLIKWKERANQLIEKYRKHTYVRIP